MADFVKCAIPNRYIGAHADTKPASCGVGSICYETDTGAEYITADGGSTWIQYAATQYFADISAANLTLSGTAGALTFSAAATIVAASGLTMPAFTLGGAVAAGDQAITGIGDLTFTDGSIIATATSDSATLLFKSTDNDGAAGAQLEVGRLVGANDPYWAFGGSQEWQFFNSGVATVAAAKTLTFGNVGTTICDTYVQLSKGDGTAGPKLKYGSAAQIVFRDSADTGYGSLSVGTLVLNTATNGISFLINAGEYRAYNVDGSYAFFSARDTSIGPVEIARLVGSADPYFRVGRDDTGVATNAVTDMLKIQGGAGTNNEAAGFGIGIPFLLGNAASEVEERASIDCVLVTATNGSEAARFDFNCQTAGAAPTTKFSCGAGGIGFFGTTPATQQAHIADASGDDAATVNAIIDALKAYGLLAPDP